MKTIPWYDHAEHMLKLAKEHYENATPEEVREILIAIGVKDEHGNHTPPYKMLDYYWYGRKLKNRKKSKSS